jgi:hypothetical protein
MLLNRIAALHLILNAFIVPRLEYLIRNPKNMLLHRIQVEPATTKLEIMECGI